MDFFSKGTKQNDLKKKKEPKINGRSLCLCQSLLYLPGCSFQTKQTWGKRWLKIAGCCALSALLLGLSINSLGRVGHKYCEILKWSQRERKREREKKKKTMAGTWNKRWETRGMGEEGTGGKKKYSRLEPRGDTDGRERRRETEKVIRQKVNQGQPTLLGTCAKCLRNILL